MAWDAAAVIAELEEAGRTLLALPDGDCRPAGFRHAASELFLAGGPDITTRPMSLPAPSPAAVSRMDVVLAWPRQFIPDSKAVLRRLVLRRALVDPVHPLDRRYLYPWRRLALEEAASHETCRNWHRAGVAIIVAALNRAGVPLPSSHIHRKAS